MGGFLFCSFLVGGFFWGRGAYQDSSSKSHSTQSPHRGLPSSRPSRAAGPAAYLLAPRRPAQESPCPHHPQHPTSPFPPRKTCPCLRLRRPGGTLRLFLLLFFWQLPRLLSAASPRFLRRAGGPPRRIRGIVGLLAFWCRSLRRALLCRFV